MYYTALDPNAWVKPDGADPALNEKGWVGGGYGGPPGPSVAGKWMPTDVAVSVVPVSTLFRHFLLLCLPPRNVLNEDLLRYIGGLCDADSDSRVASASLAGPIQDLSLKAFSNVYSCVERSLDHALPALAQLRSPSLLLKSAEAISGGASASSCVPLQVVPKFQSICLQPGEEYEGCWHRDGMGEKIIAVALLYINCGEDLEGGDLEFIDKRPAGILHSDPAGSVSAAALLNTLPRTRVPVRSGTSVVFSNYQSVHRVLKMVNRGTTAQSRDFLALFVVDQRHPLPTAPEAGLSTKLSKKDRERLRQQMLMEQLAPTGKFGVDSSRIFSTGNGSTAFMGWVETRLPGGLASRGQLQRQHWMGDIVEEFQSLNAAPPLGRASSYMGDPEALEQGSINYDSPWSQFGSALDGGPVTWCHMLTGEVRSSLDGADTPEEGVRVITRE
jgi:hypothetical protein